MTSEIGLTESEANFYSGVLVALQTIVAYGADTMAEEIIDGLGSSVKGLEIYANEEGGIDLEILNYLKDRGVVK